MTDDYYDPDAKPGERGSIAAVYPDGTRYYTGRGGQMWVPTPDPPGTAEFKVVLQREIKAMLAEHERNPRPRKHRSLARHAKEHGRLRADGWTADRQRAFLTHLAANGCVSHACAHVGLSKVSAYALRRRAPRSVFATLWDVAIHHARQAMLDEATERALEGREVEVWYHGEMVGTRRVHNDRLLMFLLARKAEPLHPTLTASELQQLWPALMEQVDVILPPPLSPDRIAELGYASDDTDDQPIIPDDDEEDADDADADEADVDDAAGVRAAAAGGLL